MIAEEPEAPKKVRMSDEHRDKMRNAQKKWYDEARALKKLHAAEQTVAASKTPKNEKYSVPEEIDIELHTPKFSVDGSLGDGVPKTLPQGSHCALFCGPPGSGKSSLWTALLTQDHPAVYKGKFSQVHIFCPPTSISSMEDSPFASHPRLYPGIDQEILSQVHAECEETAAQGKNSLVVIDDCGSDLKNGDLVGVLGRFVMNRRHLRCTVWFVTQTYRDLPLRLRKCLTTAFLFKQTNTKEIEAIASELSAMPLQKFLDVWQYVFSGASKFTFMMIHETKIHRKFSEIIIH